MKADDFRRAMKRRTLFACTALTLLVFNTCAAPQVTVSPPPVATTASTPRSSPEITRPPFTQGQLPLPTTVRWAVDKGRPDDPQQRSFLELFFDGSASGFRVIDAAGNTVLRFPISGSGVFGQESCVARERKAQENMTYIAVDQATLDSFAQRYRTYRIVAEGIPTREVTLDLTDSGCRPSS